VESCISSNRLQSRPDRLNQASLTRQNPAALGNAVSVRLQARYRPDDAAKSPFERIRSKVAARQTQATPRLRTMFVVTKKEGGAKKVVRSWLVRRLRDAFVRALRSRGYDAQGRAVDRQLVGSVRCFVKGAVLRYTGAEVQRTAEGILQLVLRMQDSQRTERHHERDSATPSTQQRRDV
jgi:hypothetical protein